MTSFTAREITPTTGLYLVLPKNCSHEFPLISYFFQFFNFLMEVRITAWSDTAVQVNQNIENG